MDQVASQIADPVAAEIAELRRRLAQAHETIAELRERDSHLRMAMEASRVVAYQWDIPNDRVTRIRSASEPGTGFEEAGNFESVVQKVLPEDQAKFRADIAAALASDEGVYRTEVRYPGRDGRIRWLSESGRVLRDAEGRPARMVGITVDITERKQTEESLRQHESLLEELLETLPVGVLIAHDPECRRITGNRAGSRLMRIEGNISRTPAEGDDAPLYRAYRDGVELPLEELPLRRVVRGAPVEDLEYELRFDDGRSVDLLVSATALHDESGAIRGAVATLLDVTEEKRARWALQEQDRRKNEFLATLSHELRNPLAPIRNAIAILHLREAPPEAKAMYAIIERQLQHMVRLVDDLLDVSRITRGRLELRRERLQLEAVVAPALEAVKPAIERAGHALEVSMPDQPAWLEGDGVRLVQVLVNLLTNAIKYTPGAGRISLRAQLLDRQVSIRITDTGIGLSPEQQKRLFEMFWQAADALEHSEGGLGIGLSLARRVVEMHGGSLVARSEGLGRGSEFEVKLPLLRS